MDKKIQIRKYLNNSSIYVKYRRVILYAVIGGGCAFLDFAIYSLLTTKFNVDYLEANVISVHAGIFCSFLFNRQYNFKVKDKKKLRFLSFYLVGLIGLALSSFLLKTLIEIMGLNEVVAKLFTIFVVALIQFMLNKMITFKKNNY